MDSLELLAGREFYVPTEVLDRLKQSGLVDWISSDFCPDGQARIVAERLIAISSDFKEVPVGNHFLQAMQMGHKLNQLGLDAGEAEMCRMLPYIDNSIVLTSDRLAISKLVTAQAALTSLFVDRVCLFGEVVHMLLAWKPYGELRERLYEGRWRRGELRNAMSRDGNKTSEFDFCARISQSHKEAIQTLGTVCRCSWP